MESTQIDSKTLFFFFWITVIVNILVLYWKQKAVTVVGMFILFFFCPRAKETERTTKVQSKQTSKELYHKLKVTRET